MKKTTLILAIMLITIISALTLAGCGITFVKDGEFVIRELEFRNKDAVYFDLDDFIAESDTLNIEGVSYEAENIEFKSSTDGIVEITKDKELSIVGNLDYEIKPLKVGKTDITAAAGDMTSANNIKVYVYDIYTAQDISTAMQDRYAYRVVIGSAWTNEEALALFDILDSALYDNVTLWLYLNGEETTDAHTAGMIERDGETITSSLA